MKDDVLKDIWQNANKNNIEFNKEQLKIMLMEKNRKIIRFYSISSILSALICIGVIIWIILSFRNHIFDPVYITINSILLIFTLTALIIILYSLKRINEIVPDKYNLQKLLEKKAKWMQKSYEVTKYQWIYLITYAILLMLSINLWQHNQTLKEIISTEENIYGFVAGLIISIPVMFFFSKKFNKIFKKKRAEYIKNLEELAGS